VRPRPDTRSATAATWLLTAPFLSAAVATPIRDEFPRERAATSTGILSSLFGVGAGLGVVITGPILDHLSYHWLFWIPFAGMVVAMLAALPLCPSHPSGPQGMSTGSAQQGSRRGWLPCCSRSAKRRRTGS